MRRYPSLGADEDSACALHYDTALSDTRARDKKARHYDSDQEYTTDRRRTSRVRRTLRLESRLPELFFLLVLFVLALSFGYWASSTLWLAEFNIDAQKGFPSNSPSGHGVLPQHETTTLSDQPPPTTASLQRRETYLKYFRQLAFDSAKVAKHGGIRNADYEIAKSMVTLTQSRIVHNASNHYAEEREVLDELWAEESFRGEHPNAATKRETVPEDTAHRVRDMIQLYQNKHAERRKRVESGRVGWFGDSEYAFKNEEFGWRSLKKGHGRCSALEADLGKPMDPNRNILFILGAQKGGTTFLFNALTKHRAFVGAEHAYKQRRGPWAKELHFFNRWPLPKNPKLEYLKCFPKKTWAVAQDRHNFTLVDATPDYLFNPMVPARIKAMWPQAKFLVLLRDPVARAYSAYKMSKRSACRIQAQQHPSWACTFPTFAEAMLNEIRVLRKQGCAFDDKDALVKQTWGSCYGCKVTFPEPDVCEKQRFFKQPCNAGAFATVGVSTYAAQLAWWFSHFDPSRFKIVKSYDLHHGNQRELLNSIVEFSRLLQPTFTKGELSNVWGYEGGYKVSDLTQSEVEMARLLRLYFRQADEDLEKLLSRTHPEVGPIPVEIDV